MKSSTINHDISQRSSRAVTCHSPSHNPSLVGRYMDPSNSIYRLATCGSVIIPSSRDPCLKHYHIICEQEDLESFFFPIVRAYTMDLRPPKCSGLCERSQFALKSYHLIRQGVFETSQKKQSPKVSTSLIALRSVRDEIVFCIGIY